MCARIASVLRVPPSEALEAAGYPIEQWAGTWPSDVPERLRALLPLLEELDQYELEVVETTARGLLRLREERARTGGPPRFYPEPGSPSSEAPQGPPSRQPEPPVPRE